MTDPPTRAQRFTALYSALHPQVLGFVQRRTGDPELAHDVVAETFTALWRRFDQVPTTGEAARAWVYTTARQVLLNHRRGHARGHALGVRLAATTVTSDATSAGGIEAVAQRVDVARAWALLSETHQESLALVVLDDLDAAGAAAVLGISPVAFRLRLSRARRALRLRLDHQVPLPAPPRPAVLRSLP